MKTLLKRLEFTKQETGRRLQATENYLTSIGSDSFTIELAKGQEAVEENFDARLVLLTGGQMLAAHLTKDEKIPHWSMTELADRFRMVAIDTLQAETLAGHEILKRLDLPAPTLVYRMGLGLLTCIVAKYIIHQVAQRN